MSEIILTIVGAVCTLAGVGIAYYQNVKRKLESATIDAINSAQVTDFINEEKFKMAVDTVYDLIPKKIKFLIPRTAIEILVQKTFDKMKEFAISKNSESK